MKKFGAQRIKINEAKDVLNDYYSKIKSPKYDGPVDLNGEIFVPTYKNPTIRLTNKSPSYKLLGSGSSQSLLMARKSP